MRHPAVILWWAGASVLAIGPVAARTIGMPQDAPALSFQVPDDWVVTTSNLGVEAVASEANSVVYAKILARPNDDPDAWINAILAKFRSRGVHFLEDQAGATAPAAPPPSSAAAPTVMPGIGPAPVGPSSAAMPSFALPAPQAPNSLDKALAAKDTPPPPKMPAGPMSPDPASPPLASSPPAFAGEPTAPTGRRVEAQPLLPPEERLGILPIIGTLAPHNPSVPVLNQKVGGLTMRALPYRGTTINGKPVDVELLIYNLPDHSALFLAQESGQTDNRVVDIVNSVRPATK